MNEYGTYKTVKASFWPWCKTVKARFWPCLSYKWFPLRSEADLVTEPRGVVFVEQESAEEEAADDTSEHGTYKTVKAIYKTVNTRYKTVTYKTVKARPGHGATECRVRGRGSPGGRGAG